jgi:IS5 family transposase
MGALLSEVNRQLSLQGLYMRSGEISMVDASVIQAQRSRPNKDKDGNSTQDPEADYNVKQGSDGKRNTSYGFKAHINVDEDGFIKATAFTAGNVHDSNHFTQLLSGDESAVYADRAYKSKKHDDWLADYGIDNRVIERAYRNKPLTLAPKKKNQHNAGVRCIGVAPKNRGVGGERS